MLMELFTVAVGSSVLSVACKSLPPKLIELAEILDTLKAEVEDSAAETAAAAV